jgi:hypothetical protein
MDGWMDELCVSGKAQPCFGFGCVSVGYFFFLPFELFFD